MELEACLTPPVDGACSGFTDLTLLVHRAAQGLRCVMDRACADVGFSDFRDWMVLTALGDGTPRSQLELARLLGIDKTTLTAVIDRLEVGGFVVRESDPKDRRARIPTATKLGTKAWATVARTRDEVERELLSDRSEAQVAEVRELLGRLADAGRSGTPARP